ncbi:hypothetical protein ACFQL8_21040 [Streptomyces goshikiensis]|uniref:hypothetical protein n=1 Tax=Streptomyces goshikiensis TaxID=1942 RepID=UPI001677EC31|nr:hypothetical protein [Streptomyces goshikiensis]GHD61386.1 hypothetical protein GCM10010336_15020 [Streptomyces goshikiensis]
MLTDREERALLAATENRIREPLRIGAAAVAAKAAVRRALAALRPTRRPVAAPADARESVTCQQQAHPPLPAPLPR